MIFFIKIFGRLKAQKDASQNNAYQRNQKSNKTKL